MIKRVSITCDQKRVDVDHLSFSAAQSTSSVLRIGESLSPEGSERAHIAAMMASSTALDRVVKTLGIDALTLYRERK